MKALRRWEIHSIKRIPITTQFPLARLHGTISSELTEIWEAKHRASEIQRESPSLPLYEKVCLLAYFLLKTSVILYILPNVLFVAAAIASLWRP